MVKVGRRFVSFSLSSDLLGYRMHMKRTLVFSWFLVFSIVLFAEVPGKETVRGRAIDSLLILLKQPAADSIKVIRMAELAKQLDLFSDYKRGIDYLSQAKQLAERIDFKNGLVSVLSIFGSIYSHQGDFVKALESYFSVLKIEESLGDQYGISTALGGIGTVYNDQYDLPRALDYFSKALKIAKDLVSEARKTNNLKDVAKYNRIVAAWTADTGISYNEEASDVNPDSIALRGRLFKQALDCYFNALDLAEDIKDKDIIVSCYGNIAIAYDNMGDDQKALDYYFRDVKMEEELGDHFSVANAMGNIGCLYTDMKKYAEAEKYLTVALKINKEIGAMNNELEVEKNFCVLYSKTNRFQLALEHYEKAMVLKDTLFSAGKSKEIARRETMYEVDKKEAIEKAEQEKQDAVMEARAKRQQLIIGSLVIGALLVLLFLIFVYRSLRVTRRIKKVIETKSRETEQQKHIIEEKNKDITASITYANRIQQAKLPEKQTIYAAFPSSFVLFKPKDIVSGDFYYFQQRGHVCFLAAADCTGHGVPGAFMSMIGLDKLDDSIAQSSDTSEILMLLNKGMKASLRQSERDDSTRDGMDIALCQVDLKSRIVRYSGANRPIWIIRKGSALVEEIKATKKAIGGWTDDSQHFESHEIKMQEGDTFYLATDGYADTFSGQNGKKLMAKKFKEILLSIQDKTMPEQEKFLNDFIENWKAGIEQVDDILVIGVRM
jgi:serine phosphatase RsbU (regulator of sigma subunit)/tetratricopeptide (TPR) repeat protein